MDRRTLIIGGVAGVAGTYALQKSAFAAGASAKQTQTSASADKLTKALLACIGTAEKCQRMCLDLLAEGKKEFAECYRTTDQMLSMCKTTLHIVSTESALAKKTALLCAEFCKACADSCGKHKEHFAHNMHLECKACMDSCIECEKLCREFAA
jgi:Cys-rich four helix bundle protein (predicted Tat secretion target)